jgi:predicted transcriptional regulator
MAVLHTVLGELERAVMDHVWAVGEADVKSTWLHVGKRRRVTSNTIQSTMDRLFKKELLLRAKVSHAFVYVPALTKQAFRAEVVRRAAESVSEGEAETILAAFVDVAATVGDDTLKRLEDLVAARRRGEGTS